MPIENLILLDGQLNDKTILFSNDRDLFYTDNSKTSVLSNITI